MLDKVLRRSDALDRESLCILAGQRVWSVRLTLHVLSSSGNVLDVAVLAGVAALRHFRRPEVEVVGDEVIVHPPESRAPVPLAFHHSPYSLTFALYTVPTGETKGEGRIVALLDPAGLEATLAQGTLSVALNAQKELCVVHKGLPSSRFPPVRVPELTTMDSRRCGSLTSGGHATRTSGRRRGSGTRQDALESPGRRLEGEKSKGRGTLRHGHNCPMFLVSKREHEVS
jgi:exosome complex component RRP45